MIIIPFGHDDMVINRLPFVTIGLILLCAIIYFPASNKIDRDAKSQANTIAEVNRYYQAHEYLKLPEQMLGKMPESFVEIHNKRQEWVNWYLQAPDEVDGFLGEEPEMKIDREPVLEPLEKIIGMMRTMPGSKMVKLGDVQKDLALSLENKKRFLNKIRPLGSIRIFEEQNEINRLLQEHERSKREALLTKLAYTPSRPNILTLVTHQFLHGGILHLIFNMLFLWIAAVKLEDIWTRPVFLGFYLLCGFAGALAHTLAHPQSSVPLVGASGAVAGLMGAFLIRLTKTEIHFFWAYWLLRLTPRWGTFKAPAYIMLPLWFIGELGSAVLFNIGIVAYWSHVGGFIAGVAIALAFKLLNFEQRVLGREPEVRTNPDEMPLIAFQPPPGPQLTPESEQAENALPMQSTEREDEEKGAGVLPAPAPLKRQMTRFALKELLTVSVSGGKVECRSSHGEEIELKGDDVAFIIAGRIDRIDPYKARDYFSSSTIPSEPGLVLAIAKPVAECDGIGDIEGYLIDGSKLGYGELLKNIYPSRQKNFIAFTKLLIGIFPTARYITSPGPLAEHNLPIYIDLEDFFSRLRKSALGLP